MTNQTDKGRNNNDLLEMIDTVYDVFVLTVFELARYDEDVKNIIIRNFISRAAKTLKGMKQLWDIQDYHDCWILYRCLLERLFTLEHLAKHNEFEEFERWSFYYQYKTQSETLNKVNFSPDKKSEILKQHLEFKERYLDLAKIPPVWRRPKAEKVAKEMGIIKLYKYGYDYGSTYVHPMADDGNLDFYNITGLEPAPFYPVPKGLLSNSILISCMILDCGINNSDLIWHNLIFQFISNTIKYLGNNDMSWVKTMQSIGELGSDFVFAKPKVD